MKCLIAFCLFSIMHLSALSGSPLPSGRETQIAGDDITFELDFDDGSTIADLACGKAKTISISGTVKFVEGIRGNALFCGEGGAKLVYSMPGNLDFDKPGSVSFWFYPEKWNSRENESRAFFFGTECSKGFLGIQVDNSPKGTCPLDRQLTLLLLYFSEIPTAVLYLPPIGVAGADKWHLLVMAWTQDTIYMSMDGKFYFTGKLAGKLRNELFPGKTFSLGTESSHTYRLDEFKIYSKKLDEREVQKLWELRKNE